MPPKRKATRRKPRRGAGIGDVLKKVSNFLRKTKLISTVGNTLGAAGVPYAGSIGSVAGKLGYGRKRRSRRTR